MSRQQRIYDILTENLEPTALEVIDDSSRHTGHAGARPEGQTHYTVKIASPAFTGKNTVACHRLIYGALDTEFKTGLHALAIEIIKD